MHTLKIATKEDIPATTDLLEALFRSSVYSRQTSFRRLDVIDNLGKLMGSPDTGVVILLLDGSNTAVGALAASHMTHLFNAKEKTAVELGFYIKPEHRTLGTLKLMLKAYRYWARLQKCTSIMMGKLTSADAIETYSLRRL